MSMSTKLDLGCNIYCSWLFGILQICKLRVSIITANNVIRKHEGVLETKEVKLAKDSANHSCAIKNTSDISPPNVTSPRLLATMELNKGLQVLKPISLDSKLEDHIDFV
jgi:hypothetical protein